MKELLFSAAASAGMGFVSGGIATRLSLGERPILRKEHFLTPAIPVLFINMLGMLLVANRLGLNLYVEGHSSVTLPDADFYEFMILVTNTNTFFLAATAGSVALCEYSKPRANSLSLN